MRKRLQFIRFKHYYRRKGLINTIRRIFQKIKDLSCRKPEILFFVDLAKLENEECTNSNNFRVECFKSEDEIIREDLIVLFENIDEEIMRYFMEERFGQGALLWLVKVDGTPAGYVWSIEGRTIRPHYFPLTADDVHLFDNLIFDKFRGRSINSLLINYVLTELKRDGLVRAFIETNITNTSEIRSLSKARFQKFCLARKRHVGERNFVIWSKVR
jgi:GNAT superfamily N-acetyltransferase